MKYRLLYELYERLKADPKLLRKVRVFTLLGFVGLLIGGSLALYAGISAFKIMASSAAQVVQRSDVPKGLEDLKAEVRQLPKFRPATCWASTQEMMTLQTWLERPVLDNFFKLKNACFDQRLSACVDENCEKTKETKKDTKGGAML